MLGRPDWWSTLPHLSAWQFARGCAEIIGWGSIFCTLLLFLAVVCAPKREDDEPAPPPILVLGFILTMCAIFATLWLGHPEDVAVKANGCKHEYFVLIRELDPGKSKRIASWACASGAYGQWERPFPVQVARNPRA